MQSWTWGYQVEAFYHKNCVCLLLDPLRHPQSNGKGCKDGKKLSKYVAWNSCPSSPFFVIASGYIKCMFLNPGMVLACPVRLCLTFYQQKVLINNLMEELHFFQGNVLKNHPAFSKVPRQTTVLVLHYNITFTQTIKSFLLCIWEKFFFLNQPQRNGHWIQTLGRWNTSPFSKHHEMVPWRGGAHTNTNTIICFSSTWK